MSKSVTRGTVVNEATREAAILIYTPHDSTNGPIRVTDEASLDSALQALSHMPHEVCGLHPSILLLCFSELIYTYILLWLDAWSCSI